MRGTGRTCDYRHVDLDLPPERRGCRGPMEVARLAQAIVTYVRFLSSGPAVQGSPENLP